MQQYPGPGGTEKIRKMHIYFSWTGFMAHFCEYVIFNVLLWLHTVNKVSIKKKLDHVAST